jgi:phenylpropionate dioxygenase-like ring-hydroxylating dioxygenase large terminal subunit
MSSRKVSTMAKTTDPVALNDWYVVAALSNLAAGQTHRTRLLGQDISLKTGSDGHPICVEIEAGQPGSVIEHVAVRYDYVWVCLGEPAQDIVDIPEIGEPGRRYIQRGRIGVATSGGRMLENFFDLSHFSFVHTGTLGGLDVTEVPPYSVSVRQNGELWATDCSFFQPKASAASDDGVDTAYNFRIARPYIAFIHKTSPSRPTDNDIIGLFVQPREETDCLMHTFGLMWNWKSSDAEMLHFFHEVFAQDRSILIHQLPKKLPLMPRREIPARCDALSVAYRRWLDKSGLQFGVDRELAESA